MGNGGIAFYTTAAGVSATLLVASAITHALRGSPQHKLDGIRLYAGLAVSLLSSVALLLSIHALAAQKGSSTLTSVVQNCIAGAVTVLVCSLAALFVSGHFEKSKRWGAVTTATSWTLVVVVIIIVTAL